MTEWAVQARFLIEINLYMNSFTPFSGQEPALSGAPFIVYTGNEPMLGGERLNALYRQFLLEELHAPQTTHLRRANIGRWLAQFGDDRPGIGLRADGLPDVVWCAVWPGSAVIRDRNGRQDTYDVGRFYISQYPVTWAQYRIFLEAEDGHSNPDWWGKLLRRDEYDREVPPIANHPAQEVSWYDAVAYCRWLSARIGYEVRLPTEWEWQHAATGGDNNLSYPWGRAWAHTHANTRESRLRGVTAVGMYPMSASPVGALDMCGTVLEWCSNAFANPEDDSSTERVYRVLRGGSWFLVQRFAHNTFRTGDDPYNRFNSVGFRLVAEHPVLGGEARPALVIDADEAKTAPESEAAQ